MICSFMNEFVNITTESEKVKGFTAKKMTWDEVLIRSKSNSCQYVKQINIQSRKEFDRINAAHEM
jgi:hypothetical protein